MEQNDIARVKDILTIVKRRRIGLVVPALSIFLISLLVVVLWKPVYRSTATILIEEQEIPREYVTPMLTSYAEQRLQVINQRIMSTARLIEVINRFDLYTEERKRLTTEEIIEKMRAKDIKFATVTADVVDPRTGRPTEATIAFTVSYEGKNPVVVQQVANALASLYLEENIKVVGQQTESATRFLEEEMKNVQSTLVELEKKIAAYKERNQRALPELLQFNLQTLDWSERNYDQLKDQLRALQERESYLQTQLATIAPDTVNQDKERLKELRVLLVSLKSRYSDEYPDVIRTKKEIDHLEKKLQAQGGETPEVPEKPDNPSYIALSAELASVRSQISAANQQIEDLDRKRNDYRRRLEMYPRVAEGYMNLMVERNNTQAKYDDLMRKYMEAKVAHGLEKEQMGTRFTLIDPARLPEKPVRPNRPLILLLGLLVGMGTGVGTVSFLESADRSARRSEDLTSIFTFPVLAEIPEVTTHGDKQRRKGRRFIVAGASILFVALLIVLIHMLVIDLDILWARIARKLPW